MNGVKDFATTVFIIKPSTNKRHTGVKGVKKISALRDVISDMIKMAHFLIENQEYFRNVCLAVLNEKSSLEIDGGPVILK